MSIQIISLAPIRTRKRPSFWVDWFLGWKSLWESLPFHAYVLIIKDKNKIIISQKINSVLKLVED
mgnify:CR=1 FL=1